MYGAAADWNGIKHGSRRETPLRFSAYDRRKIGGLHAQELTLACNIRPRVLRNRNDGDWFCRQVRHLAFRNGSFPRIATSSRFDDRRRSRLKQDGTSRPPDLRSNDRSKVGALDGRMCIIGRNVMGACASSGGMFNNYAIVQGVDHIIPVDIYLPGCPPRPEMLMDAILKLHEQIGNEKLGVNRAKIIKEVEAAALAAVPTHQVPVFGKQP